MTACGLSRNTVKKYLRASDEEPRYAKRASSSKLDPYVEKPATWLAIEATKSRKQRRNLQQIYKTAELKSEEENLFFRWHVPWDCSEIQFPEKKCQARVSRSSRGVIFGFREITINKINL